MAKSIGKLTVVDAKETSVTNSGYFNKKSVIQRFDLNDFPAASAPSKTTGGDYSLMEDDNAVESNPQLPSSGLGSLYSKEKVKSELTHPSKEAKASSFGDIDRKPRGGDSLRAVKRDPVKLRPQPGRKSDAAKQAKIFFQKAQEALSKEDIMKVNKLLVAMKGYGASKNEQNYVKAAKDLISVLVDSQVDCTRIQLISSLFPLLPMKYRYKIEKMTSILAFEKSPLRSQCKGSLSEQEFSTVRSFVLSMIFNQSSSQDSLVADC